MFIKFYVTLFLIVSSFAAQAAEDAQIFRVDGSITCESPQDVDYQGAVQLKVSNGMLDGIYSNHNAMGLITEGTVSGRLFIERRFHSGGYNEPHFYNFLSSEVIFSASSVKLPPHQNLAFIATRAPLNIPQQGFHREVTTVGQTKTFGVPFFYQTLECEYDLSAL